jgi:hypothetical protein
MKVTLWALEKIIPYGRNARKIPQQAIDKVAASIREFGWLSSAETLPGPKSRSGNVL